VLCVKTIQMTLDDQLVKNVDKWVKKLKTTRSAFTRGALKHEIEKQDSLLLEKTHREGYLTQPVKNREFAVWEPEQEWGDW